MERQPIWVAEVFPDWTTLEVLATGDVFAFNRATGRVCKIPDPDCPFVTIKWPEPIPYELTDDDLEVI